ncbi:MAG: hypothetical protein JXR76_02305 [Deltaproteobacteria bacterium]|nr:hypothetical protein [Deltaproteobacteria bacterium]
MIVIWALLIFGLVSCDAKTRLEPFRIAIHIHNEENVPMSDIPVQLGKTLIRTDHTGSATFRFEGNEGDTVTISIECPKEHRAHPAGSARTVLKKINASDKPIPVPVDMEFACVSLKREHVLVVKTNRSDLPVKINGRTVTHTNADGVAHAVVRGKTDETMHLRIDTERHPSLRPQNPSLTLALPPKRKFLFFDQQFEEMTRPAKSKKKKKRGAFAGPRRL